MEWYGMVALQVYYRQHDVHVCSVGYMVPLHAASRSPEAVCPVDKAR